MGWLVNAGVFLRGLITRSPQKNFEEIDDKDDDERRMHTHSMQVAAMERRKLKEEEKILKRAQEDEKRKLMEAKMAEERQKRDADKLAQKQEKMRRIEEIKISKQAEEESFVSGDRLIK
jgi:hypothetical protein